MDFKISDTNKGKKSLIYDGFIYRIDGVLKQAWWRKIQNLGLSHENKDTDSELGKLLKLSFGLRFVDADDVEECFVEEVMAEAPQDDRCSQFANYLVDNYVTVESRFL